MIQGGTGTAIVVTAIVVVAAVVIAVLFLLAAPTRLRPRPPSDPDDTD